MQTAISWEQRKFDEVVSRIGTGLNPRDNFVLNNGGENYYVTIKNFEHGHLCLDNGCDKVDDEALKLIQARSDLKVNDILFTSIGRIGDCYLIAKQPQNWNINESVFTLRPNQIEVEPEYLFHVIHSEKVLNQILSDVTGSTFKSIKIGDLKKTDIPKPSKSEQLKIAHFATKLENIITLHQRKCDKLQDLKKSLLEKMFPAEGSNTPSIRFKGFTDAWEQRKLASLIIKGGSGGTPSTSNPNYYSGTIPFLSITDITNSNGYIYDTEKHITDEALNNSTAWIVPSESISLAMYASVGKVAILKQNTATSQAFYNLVINGIALRNYLFQYLKKMELLDKWTSLVSTGTQANLNAEKVKELVVKIPIKKEEQSKIGDILLFLDQIITLHQREVLIWNK